MTRSDDLDHFSESVVPDTFDAPSDPDEGWEGTESPSSETSAAYQAPIAEWVHAPYTLPSQISSSSGDDL